MQKKPTQGQLEDEAKPINQPRKITDYKIFAKTSYAELETSINDWIDECGYEPHGNLILDSSPRLWVQVMVKYA